MTVARKAVRANRLARVERITSAIDAIDASMSRLRLALGSKAYESTPFCRAARTQRDELEDKRWALNDLIINDAPEEPS